jgi:hypothetical protein
MTSDWWMFLIAQSVVIVGAILLAYIRTAVAIAVLKSDTKQLKADHSTLVEKVDGISRAVGRLEGSVQKKGAA